MALIQSFGEFRPRIAPDAFIAQNATLIGNVTVGPKSSIWYGAVLRGDVGAIVVGARTNIQDLVMVHMTGGRDDALVGDDVVVGHSAIIHSAKVGTGALIGMGAILLDDCEVGEGAVVGAGSVVPPGMKVPAYTLVIGSPCKVVRDLGPGERDLGRNGAGGYVELAEKYR